MLVSQFVPAHHPRLPYDIIRTTCSLTIDLSAVSSSPPLHYSDIRIRRTALHRAHVYKHVRRIRTNGMKRISVPFLAYAWKPYTPSCIATCAEHAHLVWCAYSSEGQPRGRAFPRGCMRKLPPRASRRVGGGGKETKGVKSRERPTRRGTATLPAAVPAARRARRRPSFRRRSRDGPGHGDELGNGDGLLELFMAMKLLLNCISRIGA
jgi:hypothetical protein